MDKIEISDLLPRTVSPCFTSVSLAKQRTSTLHDSDDGDDGESYYDGAGLDNDEQNGAGSIEMGGSEAAVGQARACDSLVPMGSSCLHPRSRSWSKTVELLCSVRILCMSQSSRVVKVFDPSSSSLLLLGIHRPRRRRRHDALLSRSSLLCSLFHTRHISCAKRQQNSSAISLPLLVSYATARLTSVSQLQLPAPPSSAV